MSDSILSVSQNASVSLTRTSVSVSVTETSVESSKSDTAEKDLIDLNVAANLASQIENAESPEQLIALLGEGQRQANEALEKFVALVEKRLGGGGPSSVSEYNEKIMDAVRSVVEDLLQQQAARKEAVNSLEINAEVIDISFEARLAIAIRERDPSLAEQLGV